MCKRNSPDPLVRTFLDTYGLNLLALPRADATVGELYVVSGRGVAVPGALSSVLTPGFKLPAVQRDERLADLAGKMSRDVDAKVGLGLLETFLTAVGVGAFAQKVRASYERRRASRLRFRLQAATRDRIDPLEFGKRLIGHKLDERHPFVVPGNRYYITTAVVRTPSLTVVAESDTEESAELGAEIVKLLDAEAKASVKTDSRGELTYSGKTPVAIGVELHELEYDAERSKFTLRASEDAVRIRSTETPEDRLAAFIGDKDQGDAFITVH